MNNFFQSKLASGVRRVFCQVTSKKIKTYSQKIPPFYRWDFKYYLAIIYLSGIYLFGIYLPTIKLLLNYYLFIPKSYHLCSSLV